MTHRIVLGVDIGGSHISAMLVDLDTRNGIRSSAINKPVNSKGTVNEIIDTWVDVIRKATAKQNQTEFVIGIAMPGPFDYAKGIAWMKNQDKYDALYGLNVRELLAQKLNIHSGNIKFINDAESFLKGEVYSNPKPGAILGLTLGTGLGSARCVNGTVTDANLWNSKFRDGIAEDYLSSRWFVNKYRQLTGITVAGVKQLAELTQDKMVLQVFAEFGNNLGLFLKDIIEKENISTVILGGNISKAFPWFKDGLHQSLDQLTQKPAIHKGVLGEEAQLIGAASCWADINEYILHPANA